MRANNNNLYVYYNASTINTILSYIHYVLDLHNYNTVDHVVNFRLISLHAATHVILSSLL